MTRRRHPGDSHVWLLRFWQLVWSSLWFLPTVMCSVALALALVMLFADAHAEWIGLGGWYLTDAAGARSMLSTIAGSAITVASVVFSITMVVLSMASSQYGPRLLGNFMRRNATQLVLGTFLGTFVYAMVVLSRVRGVDEHLLVPQIAASVGLVLGLISFLVLIYFIHYVAVFIQAPRIIDDVARDLVQTIDRMFPERLGGSEPDVPQPPPPPPTAFAVRAPDSGYVQFVDTKRLLQLAHEHDLQLWLQQRPGQFVMLSATLALAVPSERIDDPLRERIGDAFVLGPDRTPGQDLEYCIDQLLQVTLRALSAGINDPYTAMTAIDRLSDGLQRISQRRIPDPVRCDDDGRPRLVLQPHGYPALLDVALRPLRRSAASEIAVVAHVLDRILDLDRFPLPSTFRSAALQHARDLLHAAMAHLQTESDRALLEQRRRQVEERLDR